MSYTFIDNTFVLMAKDDLKDRIEIEIGDIKQPVFIPQVKLKRWDNESNISIRFISNDIILPVKTDNLIGCNINNNTSAKFYEVDEGYEFDIELKEKPKRNILEFSIETKNVRFCYQPELTIQEKLQGFIRPDNVIGSYAVYSDTELKNTTNGLLS